MTTDQFRRSPLQAVRQADGTYLVRTAECCRPAACAPAAGRRCCPSARCDCPIPAQWLRRQALKASETAGSRPTWVRPAVVGSGVLVGAGAVGGVVLGVVQAVAWVVSHALVILGGTGVVLLLLGFLYRGRRGCVTTVQVIHRH